MPEITLKQLLTQMQDFTGRELQAHFSSSKRLPWQIQNSSTSKRLIKLLETSIFKLGESYPSEGDRVRLEAEINIEFLDDKEKLKGITGIGYRILE